MSCTKKVLPLSSSPESNLVAPLGITVAVTVWGESSWFFHWTKVPSLMVTLKGAKLKWLSIETPDGMSMQVAVEQEIGLGLAGKTST